MLSHDRHRAWIDHKSDYELVSCNEKQEKSGQWTMNVSRNYGAWETDPDVAISREVKPLQKEGRSSPEKTKVLVCCWRCCRKPTDSATATLCGTDELLTKDSNKAQNGHNED